MGAEKLDLAVIGYGAMARSLASSLAGGDGCVRVGGVLVPAQYADAVPRDLRRFETLRELIDARPELVVECASHSAVRDAVPAILEAGIPVVVVSIGALSRRDTVEALERAARRGKTRLTVASGAVGGLDVLRAAKLAGLDEVTYAGFKPPAAWRGTPAEGILDLENLSSRTIFFEGDATEAAALYPKNANVTAAVALAGLGFSRTKVELYADPHSTENVHQLEASGAFGRFRIELVNKPLPENPKTSWLAALSVEQAVLRHFQAIDF